MIMDDTGHALLCICVKEQEKDTKHLHITLPLLFLCVCLSVCEYYVEAPLHHFIPPVIYVGNGEQGRAGQYKSTWCTKTRFTWNGQMWLTLFEKMHCEWTIHWIPTRLFFWSGLTLFVFSLIIFTHPPPLPLLFPLRRQATKGVRQSKQQMVWECVYLFVCAFRALASQQGIPTTRSCPSEQCCDPVRRRVIGQNTTGVSSDNSTLS